MERRNSDWLEGLLVVNRIFFDHGYHLFLDCGTLLGAVREGEFIEWDSDIDLGLTIDFNIPVDKFIRIAKDLHTLGYNATITDWALYFTKDNVKVGVSLYHEDEKNEVFVTYLAKIYGKEVLKNLYLFLAMHLRYVGTPRVGGPTFKAKLTTMMVELLYRLHGTSLCIKAIKNFLRVEEKNVLVPKRHFVQLDSLEFYGHWFNIPADVEEYLILRYGFDWMTPKKNWDYISDDLSLVPLNK